MVKMSMTLNPGTQEFHPSSRRARLVRSLRWLRNTRGWERASALLAPPSLEGAFVVRNATGLFAGNLSSFVDRRMYLFGGYEEQFLNTFLAFMPAGRRGVILDVGANAGTHSLAFSSFFAQVHAFEPNPALWSGFTRNMAINNLENVRLHKIGLGDQSTELPFYSIEKSNFGLGTCSPVEQYDLPLKEIATVQVARGDDYLLEQGIGPIDAIKIDVQGFEPEVVRGLKGVMACDRPFVWVEVGGGTRTQVDTATSLQKLIPFASKVYKFSQETRGLNHTLRLRLCAEGAALEMGDYVVAPEHPPLSSPPSGP